MILTKERLGPQHAGKSQGWPVMRPAVAQWAKIEAAVRRGQKRFGRRWNRSAPGPIRGPRPVVPKEWWMEWSPAVTSRLASDGRTLSDLALCGEVLLERPPVSCTGLFS